MNKKQRNWYENNGGFDKLDAARGYFAHEDRFEKLEQIIQQQANQINILEMKLAKTLQIISNSNGFVSFQISELVNDTKKDAKKLK